MTCGSDEEEQGRPLAARIACGAGSLPSPRGPIPWKFPQYYRDP
jgi:hypothetical protein